MIIRKVISFFVLLLGAGGAFMILRGEGSRAASRSLDAPPSLSSLPLLAHFSSLPPEPKEAGGAPPPVSFTDMVAARYGTEIVNANAERGGTGDIVSPVSLPDPEVLGTILENQLAADLQIPLFSSADLRIIDVTSGTLAVYETSLTRALALSPFSRPRVPYLIAVADFVSNSNRASLDEHAILAEETIASLLAVPVPNIWEFFHLRLLNLWQRRLHLARMILNIDDDPIKAAAAARELSRLQNDESDLLLSLERARTIP